MRPFDWFLVAWLIFGNVMLTAQVGKPRKPLEPATAAISTVITLLLIGGLLWTRGVL